MLIPRFVVGMFSAKEKLLSAGTEVVGSSSETLGAEIEADMSKLGKVIKDAGIRGN